MLKRIEVTYTYSRDITKTMFIEADHCSIDENGVLEMKRDVEPKEESGPKREMVVVIFSFDCIVMIIPVEESHEHVS